MRLTNVLLFYIRKTHVPGKIDIGKNRVIPHINPRLKKAAMRNLVAEQRNLDVISKPYLSAEEESFYAKYLVAMREPEKQRLAEIEASRAQKWLKNRSMESEMSHLNVTKQWE